VALAYFFRANAAITREESQSGHDGPDRAEERLQEGCLRRRHPFSAALDFRPRTRRAIWIGMTSQKRFRRVGWRYQPVIPMTKVQTTTATPMKRPVLTGELMRISFCRGGPAQFACPEKPRMAAESDAGARGIVL
jgi:hypothetical protein